MNELPPETTTERSRQTERDRLFGTTAAFLFESFRIENPDVERHLLADEDMTEEQYAAWELYSAELRANNLSNS